MRSWNRRFCAGAHHTLDRIYLFGQSLEPTFLTYQRHRSPPYSMLLLLLFGVGSRLQHKVIYSLDGSPVHAQTGAQSTHGQNYLIREVRRFFGSRGHAKNCADPTPNRYCTGVVLLCIGFGHAENAVKICAYPRGLGWAPVWKIAPQMAIPPYFWWAPVWKTSTGAHPKVRRYGPFGTRFSKREPTKTTKVWTNSGHLSARYQKRSSAKLGRYGAD